MADGVEEEEFGDDEGFNQHAEGGDDDRDEGDDVHGSNDIKDDEAWSSQRFLEEGHLVATRCC